MTERETGAPRVGMAGAGSVAVAAGSERRLAPNPTWAPVLPPGTTEAVVIGSSPVTDCGPALFEPAMVTGFDSCDGTAVTGTEVPTGR